MSLRSTSTSTGAIFFISMQLTTSLGSSRRMDSASSPPSFLYFSYSTNCRKGRGSLFASSISSFIPLKSPFPIPTMMMLMGKLTAVASSFFTGLRSSTAPSVRIRMSRYFSDDLQALLLEQSLFASPSTGFTKVGPLNFRYFRQFLYTATMLSYSTLGFSGSPVRGMRYCTSGLVKPGNSQQAPKPKTGTSLSESNFFITQTKELSALMQWFESFPEKCRELRSLGSPFDFVKSMLTIELSSTPPFLYSRNRLRKQASSWVKGSEGADGLAVCATCTGGGTEETVRSRSTMLVCTMQSFSFLEVEMSNWQIFSLPGCLCLGCWRGNSSFPLRSSSTRRRVDPMKIGVFSFSSSQTSTTNSPFFSSTRVLRGITISFHLGLRVFLRFSLSKTLVREPSSPTLCSLQKGSLLLKMPMTADSVLVSFLARRPSLTLSSVTISLMCSLPSVLVTVFLTMDSEKVLMVSAFAITIMCSTLNFFVELRPPTMSFRVAFTTQQLPPSPDSFRQIWHYCTFPNTYCARTGVLKLGSFSSRASVSCSLPKPFWVKRMRQEEGFLIFLQEKKSLMLGSESLSASIIIYFTTALIHPLPMIDLEFKTLTGISFFKRKTDRVEFQRSRRERAREFTQQFTSLNRSSRKLIGDTWDAQHLSSFLRTRFGSKQCFRVCKQTEVKQSLVKPKKNFAMSKTKSERTEQYIVNLSRSFRYGASSKTSNIFKQTQVKGKPGCSQMDMFKQKWFMQPVFRVTNPPDCEMQTN